jgi:hypothetical protein
MKNHIEHKNRIWFLLLSAFLVAVTFTSCNKLDVKTYSQLTPNEFYKNPEQFVSAMGAAYRNLVNFGNHKGIFMLQEVSTDEAVIPQRGPDWYDGGQWIRFHLHTWNDREDRISTTWNTMFAGINNSNRLIYQFNTLVKKGSMNAGTATTYIAELKVLRAFYYYLLLDTFGNVPIVTRFANASKAPANNADFQAGRDSLFNFIEKQVKDNIEKLSPAADQSTFGRMNRWAAHFLLAKLYLNAKVYTGTSRWRDAVAQSDSIINAGKYNLAPNFFSVFKTFNQNSPEIIFAIPYNAVFFKGFFIQRVTLANQNQYTFNFTVHPWNGMATLENFYYSFLNTDVRKKGFMVGYQYDSKGNHLIDASAFPGSPHGDTLYFTPEINELYPKAWREAGARFHKFEYAMGATANLSNAFPVFRYADVLMMKAEALWRMNPGSSVALQLVNRIRERAGAPDFTSLSAYKLLSERGREFYTELWRRQDLIRFRGGLHYHMGPNDVKGVSYAAGATAFNDAWWAKPVDPNTHVNVYPIPYDQLQANPNLHQNPGY